MKITFVVLANRVGSRPDRLAHQLATNPVFREASLVVVDDANDPALADRLRPYPHVRWAVVRPAGKGVTLESIRPADRWVFMPADGILLGDVASLLVGGEADAPTKRWGFVTAVRTDDLATGVSEADWKQLGQWTGAGCHSFDTKNWCMDPAWARTVCLSEAMCLVCGPEPKGRFLPRPDDSVEIVAEFNQ